MSGEDRDLFVLPISVAGYLGGFLLVSIGYIGVVSYFKQPVTRQALHFLAALALPLAMWSVFRLWQVSRSIRRYNARGEKGLS
jgi:hypothetical protein